MKGFLLVILVMCGLNSISQQLKIEPTVSFLHSQQIGTVLLPDINHNPPLSYTAISVNNNDFSAGVGLNCWYSLNFGTASYEKFAYGIESGIFINRATQIHSDDQTVETYKRNLRIPLMLGFRTGTAIDALTHKTGFGCSAGLEYFRAAVGYETGKFLLPKISLFVGAKHIFIGANFFLMPIESQYKFEGIIEDRLTTRFYELTVRTVINWYPKRYRLTKQEAVRARQRNKLK